MVDAYAAVDLAIFLDESKQSQSIDPTLQSHGLNFSQNDIINITGDHNQAIGYQALRKLTTGNHNQAMGRSSLYNLTTGQYNLAIGNYSLSLKER